MGYNNTPATRLAASLDGIAFFEDGRFEHWCGMIGIEDCAGVLREIERLHDRYS
jgi:hypothetical protein